MRARAVLHVSHSITTEIKRASSMFVSRSKNVLLLFPVIPQRLPPALHVAKGMRHPRLRVCVGHCARQGMRDHMEDRVALVPTGLCLNVGSPDTAVAGGIASSASGRSARSNGGSVRTVVSKRMGAASESKVSGRVTHTYAAARRPSYSPNREFCFAGVYDGHAGHHASEFLRQHLHLAVEHRLCVHGNHQEQLAQAFADVDSQICSDPELAQSGSCAVVACVLPRQGGVGMDDVDLAIGATPVVLEGVEEAAVLHEDGSPASRPRPLSPAAMPHLLLPAPAVTSPGCHDGSGRGSSAGAGAGAGAGAVAGAKASAGYVGGSGAAVMTPPRVETSTHGGDAVGGSRLLSSLDEGEEGDGLGGDSAQDGNTAQTKVLSPHMHQSMPARALGGTHHLPARRVSPARLLVAHVGDSSAILCRAGTAEAVCAPHKPDEPAERERIEAAGGKVADNGRIHGILATSRAFGDVGFKASFEASGNRMHVGDVVVADPDVIEFDLLPSDEFLILASDGLLAVMNMQQAVNLVKRELLEHADVGRAAEVLVAEAITTQHSTDNVAAVIMCFHQAPPAGA